MIRTLVAATLAAIGSMYLPELPELDRSAPVEAFVSVVANSEAEAVELGWAEVEQALDQQCAERARPAAQVQVGTEQVQWVPGGYRADVAASGWCRFHR